MNNCLRWIPSRKNYPKIYIFKGYYFQKINKSSGNNNDGSASTSSSSSSSDSSSESGDSKLKMNTNNSEDKIKKLNDLLIELVQQDTVMKESKINLAQPPNRRQIEKIIPVENEDQKIARVVKEAADEIGGDKKTTESELLKKLLNPEETTVPKNLTDIIKDMKIDRDKTFSDESRAEQVRSILEKANYRAQKGKEYAKKITKPARFLKAKPETVIQKIDLFGSQPLGIFTNIHELKDGVQTKTWLNLQNRDLRLAVTHPPTNYFQQMILWTEQGKIWKFPIDNEYGLDEEKKTHFSQHIFLEEHLEPWCPQKGPIRHFMELVCVGLSKNSYLSVQAKKDHIEWFKNYFESKKPILKEVGALQDH